MVTHLLVLIGAADLALVLLAFVLTVPGSPPPVNPPPPTVPMPARRHAEDAVTEEIEPNPAAVRQLARARRRERLVQAAGYAERAERRDASAESAEGDGPTA